MTSHILETVFCGIVALTAQGAWAQSGADALLDSLQGPNVAPAVPQNTQAAALKPRPALSDSFQRQFYSLIETYEDLPYDIRQWADLILSQDYAQAAHLWTAIQLKIPGDFQNAAEAAHLYTLLKLNLPQTFFVHWMKNLGNGSFARSKPEIALEGVFTGNIDQWLIDHSIVLTPEQEATIARLDSKKPFVATLKAWTFLRKKESAIPVLNTLPAQNRLRPYLAETVLLSYAQKNNLVGAAKVLKSQLEPFIIATHDREELSQLNLTIARLLYQSGQLKAAEEYYSKVPNSSRQYLLAQEELTWILLRRGDSSKLRGQLTTLSSPLFKDQFSPEVYLVRAISNLKMCFYDAVEKDFDSFNQTNSIWAKSIDKATNSSNPPSPYMPDLFSTMARKAVESLTAEQRRLKELADQSIGATLPAVGPQKHWREAQATVGAALELARKNQDKEYNRQWKNMHSMLTEAIRKMRFVKVEYLSQVRALARSQTDKGTLVASGGETIPSGATLKRGPDELSFPLKGELWPDELFRLRSTAQSQCLKNIKDH